MVIYQCPHCEHVYEASISPLGLNYFITKKDVTKMIKVKIKDEKEICYFCAEKERAKEHETA